MENLQCFFDADVGQVGKLAQDLIQRGPPGKVAPGDPQHLLAAEGAQGLGEFVVGDVAGGGHQPVQAPGIGRPVDGAVQIAALEDFRHPCGCLGRVAGDKVAEAEHTPDFSPDSGLSGQGEAVVAGRCLKGLPSLLDIAVQMLFGRVHGRGFPKGARLCPLPVRPRRSQGRI